MSIHIRISEKPRMEETPPVEGQGDLCWRFALVGLDGFEFSVQTVVSGPADQILTGTVTLYAPQSRIVIAEDGKPSVAHNGRTLQETRRLDPDRLWGLRALRSTIHGRVWTQDAVDAFPQEWADAALRPEAASAIGGIDAAKRLLSSIALVALSTVGPLLIDIRRDDVVKVHAYDAEDAEKEEGLQELAGLISRAAAILKVTPGLVTSPASAIPLVTTETMRILTSPPSAHLRMEAFAAITRWAEADAPGFESKQALLRDILSLAGMAPEIVPHHHAGAPCR